MMKALLLLVTIFVFDLALAFWPTDLEVVTFQDKVVNHATICQQPKLVGDCRALKPRWYFNKDRRACEKFSYGGCGGNDNNFMYLEECERVCEDNQPCNDKTEKIPSHSKRTMQQNKRGCPVYKVTTDAKRTFLVYEGAMLAFNCNITMREEKSNHEIHHERCTELCKYKPSCNAFVWSTKTGYPVCRLLNAKNIQDLRTNSVDAPEGVCGVFLDKIK